MGPLVLLAGALERGQRTRPGAAVVIERAGHGQLARLAAIVALSVTLLRTRRLGALCRGYRGEAAGRGNAARRPFGRRGGLGNGRSRSRPAFLRSCGGRGLLDGRLRGRFHGCASGLFLGTTILFGTTPFFLGRLCLGALFATTRLFKRGHPRFLGLAQQALLHLAALERRHGARDGGGCRARRRRRSHRAGCSRSRSSWRTGRRRRGGRGCRNLLDHVGLGFARPTEHAAALDLDDDGVRPAMAEALLHLTRLDRALEAQRRAHSQFRLVVIAHLVTEPFTSNFKIL